MSMQRVDARMVHYITEMWDKQECQDLIEVIKVELKADLRKGTHRKHEDEIQMQLIDNVQNLDFWVQLQILLNEFNFDF